MRRLEDLYIPDHLEDYRKILGALLDVNNLVSNPVLPSNYSSVLQKWREAWSDLRDNREISEPNKIHILNDHLEVSIIMNVLVSIILIYSRITMTGLESH